jgi:signal transduction histidine kinase
MGIFYKKSYLYIANNNDRVIKKFKIDARLILQLGRDSIKDHSTALVELVKNSFDADASKVEIEIQSKGEEKKIRVADNGFGMTGSEIQDNWLRIGFSEKKESKTSKKGRRKTGEKGIGRIASDRLGVILKMFTKSEDDVLQGIEVNWDEFDVPDKSLDEIELKEIKSPKINIPVRAGEPPRNTGTELLISNLRTNWTETDVRNLYQELSFFSPLFKDEFEIEIKNDINAAYSKIVKSAIYETAEIELTLHYNGEDELIYEFKNKVMPELNKTEIKPLNQVILQDEYSPLDCGAIDLKLYFFVRKKDLLEGTGFSLSDLKDFLSENYGVKLYRDKVVVKPYGFANNQFGQDWLGLDVKRSEDPAGVSRPTYKVMASNIVGYAYFTRDNNPKLIDSSSREGLVENKAFRDLKELINASVTLLAGYRHDINKEANKNKSGGDAKTTAAQVRSIRENLQSVVKDLEETKAHLDKGKNHQNISFASSISKISEAVEETEETFEKLLEEKRVLNALATLGISSAVFGHETESAINTFRKNAKNAKDSLCKAKPEIKEAINELSDAITYAKIVGGWGQFALSRIENEKKKKVNIKIKNLISDTIKQVKPAFDGKNIEIEKNLNNVMARAYPMDIESIILNLLTNSFNAVPNSKRPRKVQIDLDHENIEEKKGMKIIVGDSGPGIAKEYIDKIWMPLWTTKVGKKGRDGTGLGLTIVKSIVDELGGKIEVGTHSELGGAKFSIWLPR